MNENFDFEKSLHELEQNVLKLEQGNLTLDQSVKLFQTSSEQTKVLKNYLDQVQVEIDKQMQELRDNQEIG
ncbi:MAG: exodeoxyribonuclease VII small subunit [Lactobacillaceae bacterium]|jgi:exodeoxyribonuclease VII small subunit|nr:exodeoxyribonuclease VII small subunit [Lactobacillaceae bacterium]